MKYRFVDDVIALDVGARPRIEVAKTFASGDDAFSGPAGPDRVPASLLVELMATTGGHLLMRRLAGDRLPLLVAVRECAFGAAAGPDVALRAVAWLEGSEHVLTRDAMAEVHAEVRADELKIASARLRYLCVPLPVDGLGIVEPSAAARSTASRTSSSSPRTAGASCPRTRAARIMAA